MANSTENTESGLAGISAWFIVSRIITVVFVLFLSMIGNGFVLWFYGKNKKLTGQVYILALAVIDLLACVVMLPQLPLVELQPTLHWPELDLILRLEGAIHIFSYIAVQVAMALDQFIAVFWPFRHTQLQRRLSYVMLSVACAVIAVLQAIDIVGFILSGKRDARMSNPIGLVLNSACMLTLLTVYPATACKLYRLNRNVKPLNRSDKKDHSKTASTEVKTNSMHVQALKIYTAVLLQFLLSNLLVVSAIVLCGKRWMLYFFFINHIGNPVIYYCFVGKFREGIHQALRSCAGNCPRWKWTIGYQ